MKVALDAARTVRLAKDRRFLVVAAWGAWLVAFTASTRLLSGNAHARLILGDVVYLIGTGAPILFIAAAARNTRDRHRRFWRTLAGATACWFAGDIAWAVIELGLHSEPFPSVADVFYVAGSVLAVVAVVRGFSGAIRVRVWRALLDASIIVGVVGYIGFRFLVQPQLSGGYSILAVGVGVAYPLLDIALLVLVGTLAYTGHKELSPAIKLVGAGFVVMALADIVYTRLSITGTYESGSWLDIAWQAQAACVSLGAFFAVRGGSGPGSQAIRARDNGFPLVILGFVGVAVVEVADAMHGSLSMASVVLAVGSVGALVLRLAFTTQEKEHVLDALNHALAQQERLAITDGLTGLHNRRFFDEMLRIEIDRAQRASASLGLLMLDIDRFKAINDEHGHPAGDDILVQLAGCLREQLRSSDVVARLGGEEFVILMSHVDEGSIFDMGDRLRRAVESRRFLVSGMPARVTISVGGARFPDDGTNADALVRAADAAMYDVKRSGRNGVQIGRASGGPISFATEADPAFAQLSSLADEIDALLAPQAHSFPMSLWADRIAAELGLDPTVRWRARMAARFHDLGKFCLPRSLLLKPGPLTDDEWKLIEGHPLHGARLLRLVPVAAELAEIVRQHHEWFDGTGYPDGLERDSICIEARVVAVCDAWAAMRADRPYRASRPKAEARAELERGIGIQFDPIVVEAFLALETRDEVGALMRRARDELHITETL